MCSTISDYSQTTVTASIWAIWEPNAEMRLFHQHQHKFMLGKRYDVAVITVPQVYGTHRQHSVNTRVKYLIFCDLILQLQT